MAPCAPQLPDWRTACLTLARGPAAAQHHRAHSTTHTAQRASLAPVQRRPLKQCPLSLGSFAAIFDPIQSQPSQHGALPVHSKFQRTQPLCLPHSHAHALHSCYRSIYLSYHSPRTVTSACWPAGGQQQAAAAAAARQPCIANVSTSSLPIFLSSFHVCTGCCFHNCHMSRALGWF
jgi:hypothetical protein